MMNLIEYVNKNFKSENRQDKYGNQLYRTLESQAFYYYLKNKFDLVGEMDTFIGYLFCDELMCIITYSEGDYYFKKHEDIKTYSMDKEETLDWYNTNL